jgi:hypothetical protein
LRRFEETPWLDTDKHLKTGPGISTPQPLADQAHVTVESVGGAFRDRRRQLGLKQVTAETRTTTRLILRPGFGWSFVLTRSDRVQCEKSDMRVTKLFTVSSGQVSFWVPLRMHQMQPASAKEGRLVVTGTGLPWNVQTFQRVLLAGAQHDPKLDEASFFGTGTAAALERGLASRGPRSSGAVDCRVTLWPALYALRTVLWLFTP